MARRGGASRARAGILAIGASAVIHLAILAILFWSTDSRRLLPEPPPMFVSLRRLDLSRLEAPNIRPRSTRRLGKTAAVVATMAPASTPPPPMSPTARDVADESQLAARAALLQSLGEGVRCADPDVFKMNVAERERCQHAASELARDGRVYAVLPADPVKAAAFERAARMNDAWRQYNAGSRNYPGLLTLFGHDAEPCPAQGKCWRHIP